LSVACDANCRRDSLPPASLQRATILRLESVPCDESQ
jgi:hypothetical protein